MWKKQTKKLLVEGGVLTSSNPTTSPSIIGLTFLLLKNLES